MELRRRGARFGKVGYAMSVKFDGHTDSWNSVSLEVESFKEILRLLNDSECAA